MFDRFETTLCTTKLFLLLDSHSQCFGREKDSGCRKVDGRAVEVHGCCCQAKRMINKVARLEEIQADVPEPYEELNLRAVKGQLSTLLGLSSFQAIQKRVMWFLCVFHQDYSTFTQAQQLLYTTWIDVWKRRVESLNVDEVLGQYCSTATLEYKMVNV